MVDADDVEVLSRRAQTAHPPGEAILLHALPVVDGVAPVLAVGVEPIGRAARDDTRTARAGQLEVLGVRPDVGGVQRDVDGDIADDLDAVFVRIGTQTLPLGVEAELQEALEIDLVAQLLTVARHGLRLVHPDIERPLCPRAVVIICFDGHKEHVLIEP